MIRIAIPVLDQLLNPHFGQSPAFVFIDADPETKQILAMTEQPSPEQLHGAIVPWLVQQGATHVIAGGMGGHMHQALAGLSIVVTLGAPAAQPRDLAQLLLDGKLTSGTASCACSCNH